MTILSRLAGIALLALLVFTSPALFSVAHAQEKPRAPVELHLNGREDDAAVDKILSSAGRTGAPLRIRVDDIAAAKPAGSEPSATATGHFALIGKGVLLGLQGLRELGQLPEVFAAHWRANEGQLDAADWMHAVVALIAALAAAMATWLLVGWIVSAWRVRAPAPASLRHRLMAAIRIALADLAGIAVFFNVSHAINDAYVATQTKGVAEFHAIGLDRMLPVLFGIVGARMLLGKLPNGERLLPIPNGERYFMPSIIYTLIGGTGLTFLNVLYQISASPAQIAGAGMIIGTIIMLYRFWFYWWARHDIGALILMGAPEGTTPSRLRVSIARVAGRVLAFVPVVIWAMGIAALAAPGFVNWVAATQATNFFIVFGPLISIGLKRVVQDYLATHQPADITPPQQALNIALAAAAAAIVWVLAAQYLEQAWSHYIDTFDTRSLALLRGLKAAALTLVAGYIGWVFLKAMFDGYAPRQGATTHEQEDADESEPTIQSRLGSVLPVVRGVALALIAMLTLLFGLTQLGVDTGPLLAGFGIAGLALSFGSQALVRDVVSGIFFLADDAFRVGEYIDTGRLKGTVEKLTLRSVQLRHQSGLVHTIPYGQIQGVTNASRDWATLKFTIRLDRDADIEKARKTIKKVGQELLEHEEFGSDFIMPVKLQGITDIQDNALVARIKFTAKPFRTSQIQREALKRIYIGLKQAGVALATADVRVRGGEGHAPVAAAHSASLQAQAAALPAPAAG